MTTPPITSPSEFPQAVPHSPWVANRQPAKSPSRQEPTTEDPSVDLLEILNRTISEVVEGAPAWLVSLIFHLVLLIGLGLWFIAAPDVNPFVVQMRFASDTGEQLEEMTIDMAPDVDQLDEEQIIAQLELPLETEPLAAAIAVPEAPEPISSQREVVAPSLGRVLDGRKPASRKALLKAYGGTALTEAAVLRGLNWLRRNRKKDGGWSLTGPYKDGSRDENRESATALALLAFQGAGNTTNKGAFRAQVRRGTRFLLKRLQDNGKFYSGRLDNHALYTQAQATMAVSELFAMTGDEDLHEPAQRAVDYCVRAQSSQGGWRYHPGHDADTSVTGWFLVALKSAQMAGLDVPSQVFIDVSRFLDRVANPNMDLYAYVPGELPKPSMTAEALLCRQYLGWPQDDERLISGVKYLLDHPIQWRQENSYYWYYATQVMHHMQGDDWKQWNNVMRVELPAHQVDEGRDNGSWSPNRDRWGVYGGRLFNTCMHIYMLEVYYRHLPIYEHVYQD